MEVVEQCCLLSREMKNSTPPPPLCPSTPPFHHPSTTPPPPLHHTTPPPPLHHTTPPPHHPTPPPLRPPHPPLSPSTTPHFAERRGGGCVPGSPPPLHVQLTRVPAIALVMRHTTYLFGASCHCGLLRVGSGFVFQTKPLYILFTSDARLPEPYLCVHQL